MEQYYEQMKQSILENSNYIEALLETAEALYTVNLTQDRLEQIFHHRKKEERIFDFQGELYVRMMDIAGKYGSILQKIHWKRIRS